MGSGGQGAFAGTSPLFPRAACAFPAYYRHPVSMGHWGFIREGAGRGGGWRTRKRDGIKETNQLDVKAPRKASNQTLHSPAPAASGLTFSCLGL